MLICISICSTCTNCIYLSYCWQARGRYNLMRSTFQNVTKYLVGRRPPKAQNNNKTWISAKEWRSERETEEEKGRERDTHEPSMRPNDWTESSCSSFLGKKLKIIFIECVQEKYVFRIEDVGDSLLVAVAAVCNVNSIMQIFCLLRN